MSISINPNPAMTKFLVDDGTFRDDPVVIVDVGARWGFRPEWRAFGESLKVYCFEADGEECARLNAAAIPNVTYIAAALAGAEGGATLYEARLNASTGLYRTNMEYFSRLLNRDNGEVSKQHRIRTTTLDVALAQAGVPAFDFIKLDVEGAELDVLRGAERFLSGAELLGILSEIRFHEEINGSPVFSELDAYVRKPGFRLFGLDYSHQSRRALPYPGLADYRLPNGEKFYAYTTHGQVMDGDALYFRDLLIPTNQAMHAAASPTQLLKAASLFEIYCLNDCAAELIIANRERLGSLIDFNRLLDLLTPPLGRRAVGYQEYLDAYFDPESAVVDNPSVRDAVTAVAAVLRRLLRR